MRPRTWLPHDQHRTPVICRRCVTGSLAYERKREVHGARTAREPGPDDGLVAALAVEGVEARDGVVAGGEGWEVGG